MASIVLAFIATYFIELLYRRILLARRCNEELKKFNKNKETLMKIDLSGYKLGDKHIY